MMTERCYRLVRAFMMTVNAWSAKRQPCAVIKCIVLDYMCLQTRMQARALGAPAGDHLLRLLLLSHAVTC